MENPSDSLIMAKFGSEFIKTTIMVIAAIWVIRSQKKQGKPIF
ncbi:hypothetical protein [Flammeovirga pectinis]|nr:hypothetical protein [Flammeovirga pectinis]